MSCGPTPSPTTDEMREHRPAELTWEFVERHHRPLIRKAIGQWKRSFQVFEPDDFYQQYALLMHTPDRNGLTPLQKYDATRGCVSHWLTLYLSNMMHKTLAREVRRAELAPMVSFDDQLSREDGDDQDAATLESLVADDAEEARRADAELEADLRRIAKEEEGFIIEIALRHVYDGMTVTELMDECGISRFRIERAIKALRHTHWAQELRDQHDGKKTG